MAIVYNRTYQFFFHIHARRILFSRSHVTLYHFSSFFSARAMSLSASRVNYREYMSFLDWEDVHFEPAQYSHKHCHRRNVFWEWCKDDGVWRNVWWVGFCGLCRKAVPFTCGHASCIPQQMEYPVWQASREKKRMKFYVDPRTR